jgi:hypothetical protein
MKAFAHAMAFSLAAQSRLYILHVAKDGENRDLYSQPRVRELLALWGKMNPQEPPEAIEARTGVEVLKVAMHPGSPRQRIDKFIASRVRFDGCRDASSYRAHAPGLGVGRRRCVR